MSSLYAEVLGIVVLTRLIVSLLQLRGVKTKADYLLAGRRIQRVTAAKPQQAFSGFFTPVAAATSIQNDSLPIPT